MSQETSVEDTILVEDRGKEFIDNYLIGNHASTGKKWFNLPGIVELQRALEEEGLTDKVTLPQSKRGNIVSIRINTEIA